MRGFGHARPSRRDANKDPVHTASSAEIQKIVDTIAEKAGEAVAQNWFDLLTERARSLSEPPFKGVQAFRAGLRKLVVAPYVIVYRVKSADNIDIVSVVHGARDLPRMFRRLKAD